MVFLFSSGICFLMLLFHSLFFCFILPSVRSFLLEWSFLNWIFSLFRWILLLSLLNNMSQVPWLPKWMSAQMPKCPSALSIQVSKCFWVPWVLECLKCSSSRMPWVSWVAKCLSHLISQSAGLEYLILELARSLYFPTDIYCR